MAKRPFRSEVWRRSRGKRILRAVGGSRWLREASGRHERGVVAGHREFSEPIPEIDFLWWKLDETSGSVANDSGPSNYDNTLLNASWSDGLVCPGSDCGGSVVVANSFRDQPLTISAWLTPSSRADKSANSYSITPFPPNAISNDVPTKGGYGIGLNVWTDDGGGSELIIHAGGGVAGAQLSGGWNAGQRYHIVVVYKKAETIVYVDGAKFHTFAATDPENSDPTELFLGRHNDDAGYGTKRFFSGTIQDVRVWQKLIDADQIAQLYSDGPV